MISRCVTDKFLDFTDDSLFCHFGAIVVIQSDFNLETMNILSNLILLVSESSKSNENLQHH